MRSIDEQIAAMADQWPRFQLKHRDDRAALWEGPLAPDKREHLVRIFFRIPFVVENVSYLSAQPRVQVIKPILERHDNYQEGPIPHVYWSKVSPELPYLCLFDPVEKEWSLDDLLAHTTVFWAAEWLYFYEGWLVTKKWRGGGRHFTMDAVGRVDDDDKDADTLNLLAQPEWVSHEVKRYAEGGMFVYAAGLDRPSRWYELKKFSSVASAPGVTDVKLDDSYAGEGEVWNRGHMATRNLVNRLSAEAGCNTHTFANAVPQFWSMNQGEWHALENYTGALANELGKAWAINGPIFLPDHEIETIGGDGEAAIPIPHALFKVIVFQIDEDIFVRAFLFFQPNYATVKSIMASNGGTKPLMGFRHCDYTDQDAYDFSPFVSSLTEIEQLTGITFFPDATPSEKEALNEFSSRGIWKVDLRFYERPCGGGE